MRVVIALAVSLWMAGGGCMFGCSSTVNAATRPQALVAPHSGCHANPKKARSAKYDTKVTRSVLSLLAESESGRECPLAASATTGAGKSSGSLVERAVTVRDVLPVAETQSRSLDNYFARLHLPNRGPTYLRYCVLLI